MAELTITEGPGAGLCVPLTPDQAYSLGSGDTDTIQVPGDGVHPRHALIKALKSGGFGIKGVAGPFFHNGRETQAARLADGDRISLGDCFFAFRDGSRAAGTSTTADAPAEDAAPAEPPPFSSAALPTDAPTELGGFKIRSVLGQGGMGTVYRAEQVSLGREVALKVLSNELTKDPVFVARFVAEARAAARLHHPNVVQVFDVDSVDDTYYYSMELMHSGSVEDRLRREGTLAPEAALAILRDAAAGLGYAESLGMVHRDIKPDNLMVDQHGHVKLADLGLAGSADDESDGKLLGTPHFMAPEQIQRKPLDHRTDLYALGCTAYRLLTGRAPFKRSSVKEILRAHLKDTAEPPSSIVEGVPAEVDALVARLLEKDPDARFQSATEVVEAIDNVAEPAAKKSVLIAVFAVAVLAIGGTVAWALSRPNGEDKPAPPPNVITDPETAAERDRMQLAAAEAASKAAYFEVKAKGLEGLTQATALDAMAAEHPGTEFATKATEEAAELRTAVANAQATEQARAAAIAAAAQSLRTAFAQAIESGDLRAADTLLDLSTIDASLRETPEVISTASSLSQDLATAGAERLQQLKSDVRAALNAADPDLAEQRLTPLTAATDSQNGWPARALGEAGIVTRFVDDMRIEIRGLRRSAVAAQEGQAWDSVRDAAVGKGGLLESARHLDLEAASQAAAALAAQVPQGTEAATHLANLVPMFNAGARFATDFAAAMAAGSIKLNVDDVELTAVRFAEGDGPPALVFVEPGRRGKEVEIDPIPRLAEIYRIPGVEEDDPGRTAFLTAVLMGVQSERTRTFLASVQRADDETGIGEALVNGRGNAVLTPSLPTAMAKAPEQWRSAGLAELTAAQALERALRAFALRRNTAAAQILEQLLQESTGTLLVQSLQ